MFQVCLIFYTHKCNQHTVNLDSKLFINCGLILFLLTGSFTFGIAVFMFLQKISRSTFCGGKENSCPQWWTRHKLIMAPLFCGYLHVILKDLKAAAGLLFTVPWLIVTLEQRSVNSQRAAEQQPWHFPNLWYSDTTSAHPEEGREACPVSGPLVPEDVKKQDQNRQTDIFVNEKATFSGLVILVKRTTIYGRWSQQLPAAKLVWCFPLDDHIFTCLELCQNIDGVV